MDSEAQVFVEETTLSEPEVTVEETTVPEPEVTVEETENVDNVVVVEESETTEPEEEQTSILFMDQTEKPVLKLKATTDEIREMYRGHSTFHAGDSGFDLFFPEDVTFYPGETKLVDLGVQTEMLESESIPLNVSYYLYPRSSIAKTPLMLANHVGIVDAGYRGNLKAALRYVPTPECLEDFCKSNNFKFVNEKHKYEVKKGDRLVQVCAPNLEPMEVVMVSELSSSERGEGGFGSTNKVMHTIGNMEEV